MCAGNAGCDPAGINLGAFFTEEAMTSAKQTPLIDSLAAIPAGARLVYEHNPTSHSMIPVGKLAAEAVAALCDAAVERDRLFAQVQDLLKGWAEECDKLKAEGTELVDSLTRQLQESVAEQDRLTAENAMLLADLREYQNVCDAKQDIINCEVGLREGLTAENEKAKADRDSLWAELAPCEEYRKDGESLVQCIERNRQDWIAATKMLATERATNERLRAVLHGIASEYDDERYKKLKLEILRCCRDSPRRP